MEIVEGGMPAGETLGVIRPAGYVLWATRHRSMWPVAGTIHNHRVFSSVVATAQQHPAPHPIGPQPGAFTRELHAWVCVLPEVPTPPPLLGGMPHALHPNNRSQCDRLR